MFAPRAFPCFLLCAGILSQSGCGLLISQRKSRVVVDSERVRTLASIDQQIGAPELHVLEPKIEGTTLKGRLVRAPSCQRMQVQEVETKMRKERVWVDGNGKENSLGYIAGAEIGLGLILPIALPVCASVGCSEDDMGDPNADLLGLFIAGAAIGGVLVLAGIVDGIFSGTSTEKTWIEPPKQRRKAVGVEEICAPKAPDLDEATLLVGKGALKVSLEEDGSFAVEMSPLAEEVSRTSDAGVRWHLEASSDELAPIELPSDARFGLARRLEFGAGERTPKEPEL